MKKLLLVLAIGAFVASCNDSGTAEAPKTDSAAPAAVDSPAAPAPADSSAVHADSAKPAGDTTKK